MINHFFGRIRFCQQARRIPKNPEKSQIFPPEGRIFLQRVCGVTTLKSALLQPLQRVYPSNALWNSLLGIMQPRTPKPRPLDPSDPCRTTCPSRPSAQRRSSSPRTTLGIRTSVKAEGPSGVGGGGILYTSYLGACLCPAPEFPHRIT